MSQDIAKMILEIRIKNGWSQERLAQELGVSFSTVNAWERGRRSPQPFLEKAILRLGKKHA